MSALPIPPASVKYYYGRITREEAEEILQKNGSTEGIYLLRESFAKPGNYALSICHNTRVHHYSIETQYDGQVMIQDGKKFPGPVELVNHHKTHLDGFLTNPRIPCNRPENQQPMAFHGVTVHELEQELIRKATIEKKLKGPALERALSEQRQKLITDVARDLHKKQPWYHGQISRTDAETRMNKTGHEDGKFLVRERDKGTVALSISHKGETKHYVVTIYKYGKEYAIEDGPRFKSLMDLVDHYYGRQDGLLCRITKPCMSPDYGKTAAGALPGMTENTAYGTTPVRSSTAMNSPTGRQLPLTPDERPVERTKRPPAPLPSPSNKSHFQFNGGAVGGIGSLLSVQSQTWDDPDAFVPNVPPPSPSTMFTDDDPQKIYDSVPRTEDTFNLNKNQLQLGKELGGGQFGSVVQGSYIRGGEKIPVAIKTLKKDESNSMSAQESEIMKEAKIMADLAHRNVVRLIGVCRAETLMLVLELAPLGPLNKYMKTKGKQVSMSEITELMYQVAQGMKYLESVKFVHRDLAARNVLLVTEKFAKISDFGMSKALGMESNYYKAETAGKWPLKWYAPECIYYFKFDGKSDVWSYGVTLWEATSYGQKPYKGMKGQQILKMLEEGQRLEQPKNCPDSLYNIMQSCWNMDKHRRPTFAELVELMSTLR